MNLFCLVLFYSKDPLLMKKHKSQVCCNAIFFMFLPYFSSFVQIRDTNVEADTYVEPLRAKLSLDLYKSDIDWLSRPVRWLDIEFSPWFRDKVDADWIDSQIFMHQRFNFHFPDSST